MLNCWDRFSSLSPETKPHGSGAWVLAQAGSRPLDQETSPRSDRQETGPRSQSRFVSCLHRAPMCHCGTSFTPLSRRATRVYCAVLGAQKDGDLCRFVSGRQRGPHAHRLDRARRRSSSSDGPDFAREDVADSAYASDELRLIFAVTVDLPAQPRNMPVDHAIEGRPAMASQHLRDLIPRQSAARMRQEAPGA